MPCQYPDVIVYLVPSDQAGCGHYRMFYPREALVAQGHDVRVIKDRVDPGDQVVVVFQRPMHQNVPNETIPYLQARGFACVVEVDDHLSRIHPHHVSYRAHQPSVNPTCNYRWLEKSAEQADLVIGSTQELVRYYAPHGRGMMIPNYLQESFIAPGLREPDFYGGDGLKRFGWAGQTLTHPGDLDVARKAIRQLAMHPDWVFRTIGFADTLTDVGVQGEVVNWVAMHEYPKALRQFDLGVVPLQLHAFNQAKSYLKGLEYAGAGVPFVASDTEPYTQLHKMGAGILAGSRNDWVTQLRTLAHDERRREEMALAGLELARDQTYERNAWRWLEAWHLSRVNYEGRPISAEARASKGKTAEQPLAVS
jgi:glycosyltransferase involved in cell wall biosynthesis